MSSVECTQTNSTFALVVGGHVRHAPREFEFLRPALPRGSTIYDYVRERTSDEQVQRLWCDWTLQTVVLGKNHGRDAAAFYHFAYSRYNSLPEHIVFVHGHLGSHHTSEFAIASRVAYYAHVLPGAYITLTSSPNNDRPLTWNGGRRLNSDADSRQSKCWSPVLKAHNVTRLSDVPRSCCATFITQATQLHKRPRIFYEDMYECMMTYRDDQESGRAGFEFILSDLLSTSVNQDVDRLSAFYSEAHVYARGRFTS